MARRVGTVAAVQGVDPVMPLQDVSGGGGADVLIGGAARDLLTGGTGADRFRFAHADVLSAKASGADAITDFRHADGDRTEPNGLGANTLRVGDRAFRLIGSAAFSGHAGVLRFEVADAAGWISDDTDGVAAPEAGDFRL